MDTRRHLLASAFVAGGLLALTACEKPAPIVTVVSGGESLYREAGTWCFEEQTPPDCAERRQETAELAVRAGETVGVDVDRELAERGWFIELSDPDGQGQDSQPQRSEPQTGHYFTFTAPPLPSGSSLLLTVRALAEDGGGSEQQDATGEWEFVLVPER